MNHLDELQITTGRTAAVVVTYNRCELLGKCLESLHKQTLPLNAIVVVNNRSTDGTGDLLDAWARDAGEGPARLVVSLHQNTGGAGGFHCGIAKAVSAGYDWAWVMDDDVVAHRDALAQLMHIASQPHTSGGFYASAAYDESGRHVVNVPIVDMTRGHQGYPTWSEYLNMSVVRISESTFVSVLFSRDAILRVGLPIKDFFIWGDDTEYTRRMVRNDIHGYLVGQSIVTHLRPGNHGLSLKRETNEKRVWMYRFLYRNRIYIARKYGTPSLSMWIYKSLVDIASLMVKHRKPKRSFIVLRGLIAGLFFRPTIDYVDDKHRRE